LKIYDISSDLFVKKRSSTPPPSSMSSHPGWRASRSSRSACRHEPPLPPCKHYPGPRPRLLCLCHRHYDPDKDKKGHWAKLTSTHVLHDRELRCNHPGCRTRLYHYSPPTHWIYLNTQCRCVWDKCCIHTAGTWGMGES
jgi:hypothetical protein